MSISDTATVTLNVNGAQAKQAMADLQAKIKQTESTIESMKRSMASPKDVEKAKKQLRGYQKELDEMKSATEGVDKALSNIDLATPRQLEKALRTLNRQMKDMVPGSEVWNSHVEKVKELKARLGELKGELQDQESTWSKFKKWAFNTWPALDLVSKGYGAVVDGMREYVDAYATMDQEMANVRKYTGMTAEEVEALNEEFKKMDTRTSREQLNVLAQEAGRLGKTSQEEVLGFVRAADVINVALDDLGDGATLTLSKLTGIFGTEDQYGTEEAMLKVGSVINDLSQNCSASAPYIAEFASRLGGVGSQAGMTVQDIMAFAAVLDSNNQALEASSTALSQVIVRIYQEPAKYAKVAGLDIEHFTELVKTDMNGALIELLTALNQAGGMDVLSPMFKDMGENGARAVSALSTLASNIDEVKKQQIAANEAFEEGTSVQKEAAVQNSTVQAKLEKYKKAAQELKIELGTKLYPIMSHIISGSAALTRILFTVIQFIGQHKAAVIALTAGVAAYLVILKLKIIQTKLASAVDTIYYYGLVALDKAKAMLAVTSNLLRLAYYKLTGQTIAAKNAQLALSKAMKAAPWGWVALAIAGVVALLLEFGNASDKAKEKQEQLRKEQEEWEKTLKKMDTTHEKNANKEIANINALIEAAQNEALSREERVKAARKMQEMYPDYFGNLTTEQIMLGQTKDAYDNLVSSILKAARVRTVADKIIELEDMRTDINADIAQLNDALRETSKEFEPIERRKREFTEENNRRIGANYAVTDYFPSMGDSNTGLAYNEGWRTKMHEISNDETKLRNEIESINYEIDDKKERLEKVNNEMSELLVKGDLSELDLVKYRQASISTPSFGPDPLKDPKIDPKIDPKVPPTPPGSNDQFAKEKAWRKKEEATARISYLEGTTDYEQYTKRMNEIAVQFYATMVDRTKAGTLENLEAQVDYYEALKKQSEANYEISVDTENKEYEDSVRRANESYAEKISAEGLTAEEIEKIKAAHTETLEQLELDHLKKLAETGEEGSKERLEAEEKYLNARIKARERHIKEMERLRKEQEKKEKKEAEDHEKELNKYKDEYFGDNANERKQKYDKALAVLTEVYNREIAATASSAEEKLRIEEAFLAAQKALRKKYGQESEEDAQNSYMKIVTGFGEFLQSDGGKALTGAMSFVTQQVGALFQGLSTLIQAEMEIQTLKIEKKYDREVELAQGNSYKVAMYERKKEKEVAKVKKEANQKLFTMQVIQAIAQSIQSGLNAYSSTLAIPIIGPALAPAAMALALATGAIQVAAIKKQQQASEAQGYAQGGFTKKGGVNEPAGVVHAGEWVASQKLLVNPVARPLIESLDYVQRTNTIGRLRPDDVSRVITANTSLARFAEDDTGRFAMAAVASQMSTAVSELTQRLNEPFVTVNTVTGDVGIKKAQDDYQRLINNVTPKRRRK